LDQLIDKVNIIDPGKQPDIELKSSHREEELGLGVRSEELGVRSEELGVRARSEELGEKN
jgi:hypothetical protein